MSVVGVSAPPIHAMNPAALRTAESPLALEDVRHIAARARWAPLRRGGRASERVCRVQFAHTLFYK